VGRVKITRIVEMDLPVPAMVIPQATAAAHLDSNVPGRLLRGARKLTSRLRAELNQLSPY